MFESTKPKANLPLGSKENSHQHDQVNFSCPKVANATSPINQLLAVDMGETSGLDPIITHNGVEVLECFYGDKIWWIEQCPLNSNTH